jgi:hypothetical protein
MKTKKFNNLAILTLLLLLGACGVSWNSSGSKESDKAYKKIKGTVTFISDMIIGSAYADDTNTKICNSATTADAVNIMDVYLVRNGGAEEKICSSNIEADGSYELLLNDEKIPDGGFLRFKASYNGGSREIIVNKDDVIAQAPIEVNPLTTVQSKLTIDDFKSNGFDRDKLKKAEEFANRVFGEDLKTTINKDIMTYIDKAASNGQIIQTYKEFHNGKIDDPKAQLSSFVSQLVEVKAGRIDANVKLAKSYGNVDYYGKNPEYALNEDDLKKVFSYCAVFTLAKYLTIKNASQRDLIMKSKDILQNVKMITKDTAVAPGAKFAICDGASIEENSIIFKDKYSRVFGENGGMLLCSNCKGQDLSSKIGEKAMAVDASTMEKSSY